MLVTPRPGQLPRKRVFGTTKTTTGIELIGVVKPQKVSGASTQSETLSESIDDDDEGDQSSDNQYEFDEFAEDPTLTLNTLQEDAPAVCLPLLTFCTLK